MLEVSVGSRDAEQIEGQIEETIELLLSPPPVRYVAEAPDAADVLGEVFA